MKIEEAKLYDHKVLTVTTGALKAAVVTDTGPRVAFLGRPDGENLLFWDREGLARGDWNLRGGHRVWIARPGADESEDAYRPDNAPCAVTPHERGLTVETALDPVLNVKRGFTLTVEDENRLSVENFVENAGEMLFSASVWALTCTLPAADTAYGIPLGDGSEWDCVRVVLFRKWGGHTSGFNDGQITFTEDMLHLKPEGRETKRMIEAPHGILAMNAPGRSTTFVKKSGYDPNRVYPLGCNLAFYVGPDNFMVEMESMGPETALKPGERVVHREDWLLTDAPVGLDDPAALTGLF